MHRKPISVHDNIKDLSRMTPTTLTAISSAKSRSDKFPWLIHIPHSLSSKVFLITKSITNKKGDKLQPCLTAVTILNESVTPVCVLILHDEFSYISLNRFKYLSEI